MTNPSDWCNLNSSTMMSTKVHKNNPVISSQSQQLLWQILLTTFSTFSSSSSPSWGLRWELLLSIRSNLLPWFSWQIQSWSCLLLDYPGPWILCHPLQLHLLWDLWSDRHGGATGWLLQPGGGTVWLAQPTTGAGQCHRRLRHTVLLLRPHQPGTGICSALPR